MRLKKAMTIIEMLEKNVDFFPEKTAIIQKESRISFQMLYEKSNALATFLTRNGLKKGDRVGLLLQKTPEAVISFLGVAKAAGVVFPIDFNQPLSQIQYIVDLMRPTALIVSSSFESLLSKLRISCSYNMILIIGPKSDARYGSWQDVINQKAVNAPNVSIQEDDTVYLNFTSGSTGAPKGAITTHANIYWNTKSAVESLGLTHEDIHLCGFPVFSHPHELFARALYLGGTVVLTDDSLPRNIATAIREYKVTCMMAIAQIYENLVRYHVSSADFSTLRVAESGGMFTNQALIQDFKKHFNISIIPVWGSTETSGIALAIPIHGDYPPGSIGKPCPYYEVKIIGETGEELNIDEIGEMFIKGPAVCSGYFGNPEETQKTMRDGWLLTDDLVKKDSEGYFYFISRKSRMIKVAGLRVYPSEIEEVLIAHPDVAEAAVAKIQDKVLGEVPKAVVVLKEGAEINQEDLRRYCSKRMAKYKVPAIIEFVKGLPKTVSGKILYQKL